MQALANLPPVQSLTLVLIVLAFCAFGVTLFAVSLSAALAERAKARVPDARPQVTPARRVASAVR